MKPEKDQNPVATAYGLLTSNLAVLPGLGTFMGGRRVAGVLQMICAVSGSIVTLVGIVPVGMRLLGGQQVGFTNSYLLVSLGGIGLFLIAWLSSLVSGIGMIRRAKLQAQSESP